MASVRRIWTAREDATPMESVDSIRAVEGGLEGDRYLTGEGYYSPFDVCEVTFLAREALVEIRESTGIDLTDGRHRRNVVTEGVDVHDLLETRFRVGGAVFEGPRPRPPCAHVEAVADEERHSRARAGTGRYLCGRGRTGAVRRGRCGRDAGVDRGRLGRTRIRHRGPHRIGERHAFRPPVR